MNQPNPIRVLRVDASARSEASVSRQVGDLLTMRMKSRDPNVEIVTRDLAEGLPFVTEEWVGANFTDPDERTAEQRRALSLSDDLVSELKDADVLVLGVPIYNFSVPASLKAWIDLIARVRETFRYTPDGPVGLLEGKKAFVVVASGGTKVGSGIDFATPYLRHVLGFLGIRDVEIVAADRLMARGEEAVAEATRQLDLLFGDRES